MAKREKTTDAVEILYRRYIKGDPEQEASLQAERVNAEVACLIYDLRKDAGLTQKELAELIGTTQSAISRLEDADYDGHSLSMLRRVAEALKQKLTVVMTAQDPDIGALQYAFHLFVHMLRRARGLTIDDVAGGAGLDREEIVAMERNGACRPTPRIVHKLSGFYEIPESKMLELAGAISSVSPVIRARASRFAAQSESLAKATKEEKKIVDEFVRFLQSETGEG